MSIVRLGMAAAILAAACPALSQSVENTDPLRAGFVHPPASARPKAFWQWMNGHVTRDGITRDLEAMRRVGLGGVHIFDGGAYLPSGPSGYLNARWRELMTHALNEGARLGLDIGMHNAPGWSSSGGPWITPPRSMQQLVWTETTVRGPGMIEKTLPRPHANEGWYRDAFVLAFPSLPGEETPCEDCIHKITTSSGGEVNKTHLSDGLPSTGLDLAKGETLVVELGADTEIHAVTVHGLDGRAFPPLALEASTDGAHYAPLCRVTAPARHGIAAPGTAVFPARKARYVRLAPAAACGLSEFVLHRAPRIEDWTFKANFAYRVSRQVEMPAGDESVPSIAPQAVRDITVHMDASGQLRWDAPPGAWTILRIGHTGTGQANISASEAGHGLETDKFSREATEFHFNQVVGRVLADAEASGGGGRLHGVLIDSYEAGMQNWTASFPEEFRRRAGYDIRPRMPAMLGRVVGGAMESERFLYDVRRVQTELMAESYYGRMAELCRARGLVFAAEGYGQGVFDELDVAGLPDVPMGEFWVRTPWSPNRTAKMVASAAHVYGKPVVAAEAFTGEEATSRWLEYPYALKALGDDMFALGINQLVFHRYVHQPHPDAAPGMTMGPFGFFFERTNTWFEQSSGWLAYLSRCQHMLRQGVPAADVLYFTGERPPGSTQFFIPAPPPGYDYDLASAKVLLDRVTVKDGLLTLPEGNTYRMLVLPPGLKAMTPELARKLREFARQGAVIIGPRPECSPSLRGQPESDREVRRIAAELWDAAPGGRPLVRPAVAIADAVREAGLNPDFEYTSADVGAELSWLHRRLPDGDLYFVANRQRLTVEASCVFRVAGRRPELWNPQTGETGDAAIYAFEDTRTRMPLRLGPAESVFVVFRKPAGGENAAWVRRDGREILHAVKTARPPAPVITNEFTMAVWAKPDIDLRLMPEESTSGRLDETGKFYAIPAAEGDTLHGAGHAIAGLAIGRNGAYVIERARDRSPAVLVERRPVSGWTHFAMTYRDGKPRLYIDGKLAREGLASGSIVHPGVGSPPPSPGAILQFDGLAAVMGASGQPLPPSQGRSFLFEGNMTAPELFGECLPDDAIAALAARGLPSPEPPPAVELSALDDGSVTGLFWSSGHYELPTGSALAVAVPPPLDIGGEWRVAFPPGRGAPASVVMESPGSWHRHADAGVRHFSGTAVYTKTIRVPAAFLGGGKRVVLDLGRVEVVAEVRVNGHAFAPLWQEPFRVDVTDAIRPGDNALEIHVTNLWANRLIGDESLPAENEYENAHWRHGIKRLPSWYAEGAPKPAGGRTTFATWQFYDKDEPLLESGLLGPVRLLNPVRRTFPAR
ncbi:glycosyl hydrolase [Termitidicoccus mucosus]|uniref:Beta-mannosidase-like galactose-binding domain-containing protein n=1 Tax=Termitidicoccus mucosus TaxID=1184151 RepID=A0A178IF09_9BACT|nr:hypothetical protein AW736_16120 [Opitutaceae bacterium TSB47]